ncbi:MAG: homoserine O-acetyltransferase, partial [Mucilaginibacter sp.]
MSTEIFKYNKPFELESGKQLKELQIGYNTYGKLNKNADNVVWVCHALTANSDVFDWWKGLFGNNDYFNPEDYFIVCANILGSHYGTTCPLSTNPVTGQPYYLSFPEFTVRDMVKAHTLLADSLG